MPKKTRSRLGLALWNGRVKWTRAFEKPLDQPCDHSPLRFTHDFHSRFNSLDDLHRRHYQCPAATKVHTHECTKPPTLTTNLYATDSANIETIWPALLLEPKLSSTASRKPIHIELATPAQCNIQKQYKATLADLQEP